MKNSRNNKCNNKNAADFKICMSFMRKESTLIIVLNKVFALSRRLKNCIRIALIPGCLITFSFLFVLSFT